MPKSRSPRASAGAGRPDRDEAGGKARSGLRPDLRRRAILVESDGETRALCCELLAERGFQVTALDRGVATLTAARRDPPDLIMIDLQLRDVPGAEVLGWLRSDPALRSVPVIAMTALALDAEDRVLRASGVDALLSKPLSRARLERALQEIIG